MHTTEDFTPTTMPDTVSGSQAAARLLELAANSADELMTETKADAAALVATAHADADQVTASARTEARQAMADAHNEARREREEVEQFRAQQTTQLEQHRDVELSDVAEQKAGLEAAVLHLEQVERAYLKRMRSFLAEQMDQLDGLGRSEQTPLESVSSDNVA